MAIVSKVGFGMPHVPQAYIKQAYKQNAALIPLAKGPVDKNGDGTSDRIRELSENLNIKLKKETLPEFEISSILKKELGMDDLTAAWEHYLNNFKKLAPITEKLEALGFENPFLDRDGSIEQASVGRRAIIDEFDRAMDIIKAILRKRESLPHKSQLTEEFIREAALKLMDEISPQVKKNITYEADSAREDGVQNPGDTLKNQRAQCYEYSLLFYLMAKKAGLNVGMVIIPGHAYNWIEISGGKYEIDLTRGYEYFRSSAILNRAANKVSFDKLAENAANAKEIFFTHHYTKAFMFVGQKRFDEADKMIKVAYGVNPDDIRVNAMICKIGRSTLLKSNIDVMKMVHYKENSIMLRSSDKSLIDDLCKKYYSVREYIQSMQNGYSAINVEV